MSGCKCDIGEWKKKPGKHPVRVKKKDDQTSKGLLVGIFEFDGVEYMQEMNQFGNVANGS